jgi:hypothetical protein
VAPVSKLEKNFSLDRADGVLKRNEAVDVALLLEENRSLRQTAAEILLESHRLREKLRKQNGLY